MKKLFIKKEVKKTKLDTISISIDGLEKTHDDFRGVKGSYKQIIEKECK